MKKINLILSLVLILLVLVSCTGTKLAGVETVIYKGTDGLRMDILEGLPPKEMYVGTKESPAYLQIGIELENQGAYDITEGVLAISYDRKFNDLSQTSVDTFNLRGRSQLTPIGDITRKTFTVKNYGLPPGSKSVFVISGCYKYETTATVDVCISPYYSPLVKVGEDVCKAKDFTNIKLSGGQGGPVAITNVRESIRPTEHDLVEIVFAITLDNFGDGNVRSEENYDKECREGAESLSIKDIKTARIKEISFSDYSLANNRIECYPKELRVGEKTIICSAKIDKRVVKSPYLTPLKIKIGYGYVSREYPVINFKERTEI
ncbi:MAG: hypothetical protein U9R08_07040 [Nanoarchaeota archaeon]|nr:hypothetical protein [Nanoarchaeota archaeon]